MSAKHTLCVSLLSFCCYPLFAQQSADRTVAQPAPAQEPVEKRLFGIVPNFRTSPSLTNYEPLTPKEKFKLAGEDAFDRGTFILAAAFAGEGQLTNSNPSFGQGVKGYAHYFVTSYADWAIGDYMTEAVVPVVLHQDPRYFRKGTGTGFNRLLYAMGQIFWTHTDSGGHMFNFSEIGGNAASAAIAQAYYPDSRGAGNFASKLSIQVGVDMASNVMKEFYPDLRRKLSKKHNKTTNSGN
ncbi:MAG TPA: hypothetical protein VKU19_34605 [Bryobacteraceae bacterium]|nr:hypothetical protein [Bryobacteraceae bacterium]